MTSKPTVVKLYEQFLYHTAPRRLAKRIAARNACDVMRGMSGYTGGGAYEGARDSRMRNRRGYQRAYPTDEDSAVTKYGRAGLRLECQDLYRNYELVGAACERTADYVVPEDGLMPQARTSNTGWNKNAEAWWNSVFVPNCDARRRAGVTLQTLIWLKVPARFTDGDSGSILMDDGTIMPVEADRICTPSKFAKEKNILEGVKLDANGATVGYYVCDRGSGGVVDPDKFEFIPADQFIFTMRPRRVDQIRGIPQLANCIAKLVDIDETDNYVLNKVKLDATKAWGIFSDSANVANIEDRDVTPTGQTQVVEQHSFGETHRLGRGDKMESLASRTPNQEYVPYLEFQIKLYAAAIGVPWEYIMMIFTEGSFTSHRQAKLEFKRFVYTWQKWLIKTDMRRLWYWRITKAVMDGDLDAPPVDDRGVSEIGKVVWTPTRFELLDPSQETDAQVTGWKLGKTSLESIAYEQGDDPDEMMDAHTRDIQRAIDRSNAFNKKNEGANTTWRDWIDVDMPGKVQVSSPAPN